MRLKIVFGEEPQEVRIDRDYRKYFLSFVKNAFTSGGIFSELYSKKEVKPFTFSIFLGNTFQVLDDEEGDKLKAHLPFHLLFSTGDPIIFSHFYNGALEIKKNKKGISLPGGKIFPIKEIYLLKNKNIKTSRCIFKTVGVCVLTDPEQDAKDFEKWFCIPCEEDFERFNKVLEKRMIEKYERIKGEKIDTKIKFTPVSEKEIEIFIRHGKLNPCFGPKPIKEIIVKHYNGFIKGFKGVFYLESHPKMLQFIYDYGLGVKTGQGFGLVDVIAEK